MYSYSFGNRNVYQAFSDKTNGVDPNNDCPVVPNIETKLKESTRMNGDILRHTHYLNLIITSETRVGLVQVFMYIL